MVEINSAGHWGGAMCSDIKPPHTDDISTEQQMKLIIAFEWIKYAASNSNIPYTMCLRGLSAGRQSSDFDDRTLIQQTNNKKQ